MANGQKWWEMGTQQHLEDHYFPWSKVLFQKKQKKCMLLVLLKKGKTKLVTTGAGIHFVLLWINTPFPWGPESDLEGPNAEAKNL